MRAGIYRKHIFYTAAVLATVTGACKKSGVFLEKKIPEVTLSGSRLSENVISLTKDTVYVLAANLTRQANQQLLVEAGTLIKVKNNVGIVIENGGKITANGTKDAPVVFTSDALKGTSGTSPLGTSNGWSGIIINGPTACSISYVRIEFAGTGNTASLSLRNLDNTAVLNYIQVSYSIFAPAFEFTGGNCKAGNLVSYASSGTDFIFSNSYRGSVQHALAYRHPYFITNINAIAGVYIQGTGTFPAVSNVSVIGPDKQNGTATKYSDMVGGFSGGRVAALLVTNGAKFHIRNSVFAGFPKAGFYIDSKESGDSLQFGVSDFTYNAVHSNDTNRVFYIPSNLIPSNPPITAKDFKSFMLQPQFHNRLFLTTAGFAFTDPYNYDVNPNPQPQAGSPLLTGANFDGPFFGNTAFFKPVTYIGALGTDNWLQGWTNFIPLQTNYNN